MFDDVKKPEETAKENKSPFSEKLLKVNTEDNKVSKADTTEEEEEDKPRKKSVTIVDDRPDKVKEEEEKGLKAKMKKTGIRKANNEIIDAAKQEEEWNQQCAQQ